MANLTNPFDFQRHERLVNLDKSDCIDSLREMTQQGRLHIPKKLDFMIPHFTAVESKLATTSGGQAYTKYFVDKNRARDDFCLATVFGLAAKRIKGAGTARIVGVY